MAVHRDSRQRQPMPASQFCTLGVFGLVRAWLAVCKINQSREMEARVSARGVQPQQSSVSNAASVSHQRAGCARAGAASTRGGCATAGPPLATPHVVTVPLSGSCGAARNARSRPVVHSVGCSSAGLSHCRAACAHCWRHSGRLERATA